MRPRIAVARALIRIGKFMQSASLMVMRPDDLVEFSRRYYARQQSVDCWSGSQVIEEGLFPSEEYLLNKMPLKKGRLLLLGVGGGREAIPLAKLGFQVTGVDFIPEMVDRARVNAARHGLDIEGLVQDISRLEVKEGTFDVVWLSSAMYSCLPTKKKRIELLRRIHDALQARGYFICQFRWGAGNHISPRAEKVGKALAWMTLGNINYEPGDMLSNNSEFIHDFQSIAELRSEFAAGGFEVVHIEIPEKLMRGGALLRRINGEDQV